MHFRLQSFTKTDQQILIWWTASLHRAAVLTTKFLVLASCCYSTLTWSNKACLLYEGQRSAPQNVTAFSATQRVLLYFLNLSRAEVCPDSFAFFSSILFRSSSIFLLSSKDFLITSCTKKHAQKERKWIKHVAEIKHQNVSI